MTSRSRQRDRAAHRDRPTVPRWRRRRSAAAYSTPVAALTTTPATACPPRSAATDTAYCGRP